MFQNQRGVHDGRIGTDLCRRLVGESERQILQSSSKFCFGFLTDLTECLFERNVHGPTLLQGVDGVADDSAKRVLHEMQNNFAI